MELLNGVDNLKDCQFRSILRLRRIVFSVLFWAFGAFSSTFSLLFTFPLLFQANDQIDSFCLSFLVVSSFFCLPLSYL